MRRGPVSAVAVAAALLAAVGVRAEPSDGGAAKAAPAPMGPLDVEESPPPNPPGPVPRIWWSFPNDDDTAIEVDDADLSAEGGQRFATRALFAAAMKKCNTRRSKILAQHRDGTPVREIRLEHVGPDGKTTTNTRCVMTLKQWRARIGKDLVYRLDDELDAHASFLLPRRRPGMPAKTEVPGYSNRGGMGRQPSALSHQPDAGTH